MLLTLSTAPTAVPPPATLELFGELWPGGPLALLALGLSAVFATLQLALLRSVPSRLLAPLSDASARARLEPLLQRAEALAMSAGILRLCTDLGFLLLTWALALGAGLTPLRGLALSLAVSLPLLLGACEILPALLSTARADALLRTCLWPFHIVQLPLSVLVLGLLRMRALLMRLLDIEEQPPSARRLLEGLRDVIESSDMEGELAQAEREIIENAIEVHDVDVAEIMTPRTEVSAVEVNSTIEDAVRVIAESGHSRVPVFEGSLDRIVGVVSARDVILRLADGSFAGSALSELVRRPHFVPETKLVSELLGELRRERLKVAVVLDEYGGTAGIVTMGDLLGEFVGDIQDEWDPDAPAPILLLQGGGAEVAAAHRVSEVNEELGLELPEEEDYETLGGYVLAELGHFPKLGESFIREDVEFSVLEATDRRVLRVGIRATPRNRPA